MNICDNIMIQLMPRNPCNYTLILRALNSCLQTRKMRVEIQFYELKIWVLEKSCEFNNLPVANTISYLGLKASRTQQFVRSNYNHSQKFVSCLKSKFWALADTQNLLPYLPLVVNLKFCRNLMHSSNPANTVNSPRKGFLRKYKSNTAVSFILPLFQYAYAIVIW